MNIGRQQFSNSYFKNACSANLTFNVKICIFAYNFCTIVMLISSREVRLISKSR